MKTIYKIILTIALITLLVGCTTGISTNNNFKFINENLGMMYNSAYRSNVARFIDTDYNNVCYVIRGANAGGISCVSLN